MAKKKPHVVTMDKQQRLELRIRELFREIIGGLTLGNIVLPERLEGQDRLEFAKYCHQTYHSLFFKQLLEALYYPQIMHIGTKASDMGEVTFSRATANGIMLVAEMFQKWANVYDEDYSSEADKPSDPHKSFESIN